MPSEKDGVMIILSSPSGAGKTTLVKKLSEKNNFEISISHTTRKPRLNETQNEDYFFIGISIPSTANLALDKLEALHDLSREFKVDA